MVVNFLEDYRSSSNWLNLNPPDCHPLQNLNPQVNVVGNSCYGYFSFNSENSIQGNLIYESSLNSVHVGDGFTVKERLSSRSNIGEQVEYWKFIGDVLAHRANYEPDNFNSAQLFGCYIQQVQGLIDQLDSQNYLYFLDRAAAFLKSHLDHQEDWLKRQLQKLKNDMSNHVDPKLKLQLILEFGSKLITRGNEMYRAFEKCVEKQILYDYQNILRSANIINFVSRYDCCDTCTVFMIELQHTYENLEKVRFRAEHRKTGGNYEFFRAGQDGGWVNKLRLRS